MPKSNLEWELIGQGLRKLQVGLLPFVNSEMIKCYGNDWLKHPNVERILQRKNQNREYHIDNLDIDALLDIIDDNQNWEKVFKSKFKRKHRGEVINLKDIRDRHAHPCSSNDFSLDELKTKTVIALGDFNSASSFYMPTYDLFGKTLTVDMGHRGLDIVKMVKEGKADVVLLSQITN